MTTKQHPTACRCVDCGGDQPEHDAHCAYMHNLHAAQASPKRCPYNTMDEVWVGCGECDVCFPCHNGQQKCLRLPAAPMADVELLPLPSPQVPFIDCDPGMTDIRRLVRWYEQGATEYARANVSRATAAKDAEIDALRTRLEDTVRDSTNKIESLWAEVENWKESFCQAASRVERLEKTLGAYQAAVNKIDDLIEYSLPMPSNTKAALYAVLADLTATLAKEITND